MKIFTEHKQKKLFESVRKFYETHKYDLSHDIDHTARVMWWCIFLSKKEKADLSIVMPAAILHDLGMLGGIKNSHARKSYKMCYPFLKKCGYEEDEIKRIRETILMHSSSDRTFPKTIEGKVLFDADKLDAVNPISLHRWMFEYARRGYKYHIAMNKILASIKAWKRLVGRTPFYTKTGKKIGSKGLLYIEKVFSDIIIDLKKFKNIYKELGLE